MRSQIGAIRNKFSHYARTLFPSVFSQRAYTHFLKNAFWSLLGAVLLRSQIIIISIFLSQILPIHEFGKLGLIRSTIGTFTIFASVGVSIGATKFISEAVAQGPTYIKSWIRFSYFITCISACLISAAILVFAHSLSVSILKDGVLTSYLQLSAVIIFLTTILGTQIGILNGFQNFKKVALLNLYGTLLSIPLQIYLSWVLGITGFLIATAITTAIQIILYQLIIRNLLVKHKAYSAAKITRAQKRKFIDFSIPAALSGFLVTPVSWYCNTVLVKGNNGYSEMAFFEIANNWRMILIFIPATISQVVLPNITAIHEKIKIKKLLYFNILLNSIFSLVACAAFILFSSYLLQLYGTQYLNGELAFNILIASTFFVSIANVTGQLIAGKMKMWYGFILNTLWAVAIIALSIYFIQYRNLGAEGLALAYFCSYSFHTLMQVIVFRLYFRNFKEPANKLWVSATGA